MTSGVVSIVVPTAGLVLLVGPAGAGKTTFARHLFKPTEIVSSDACRALVSDGESNQAASADAFRLLREITALRLKRKRLTVVDATNVEPFDRLPLLRLAQEAGLPAVAVVFDLPVDLCVARSTGRPGRRVAEKHVRRQWETMLLGLPGLAAEPAVEAVHILKKPEEVDAVEVRRARATKLRAS